MSTTEELKPSKGDDAVPAEDTPEEPQQRFSPEEEKVSTNHRHCHRHISLTTPQDTA